MNERKIKIKYLFTIFLAYQLMVFFVTPFLINYLFQNDTFLKDLLAQLLSFTLPVLLVLIFSSRKEKMEGSLLLFSVGPYYKSKLTGKMVVKAIIVGVILSVAFNYMIHFIECIYILLKKDYSIISTLPSINIFSIISAILIIGLLPAIFEELLYRGMYFDTFKNCKYKWQYLIPTIVFALNHANVFSGLSAIILSILLIFIMIHTQSIVTCSIIHFIYNIMSIVFTNIITLPLSPLRLLENYASDQMFIGALLFYSGIIMFLSLCVSKLFKSYIGTASKIQNDTVSKFSMFENVLVFIMLISSVIFFLSRVLT